MLFSCQVFREGDVHNSYAKLTKPIAIEVGIRGCHFQSLIQSPCTSFPRSIQTPNTLTKATRNLSKIDQSERIRRNIKKRSQFAVAPSTD